MFKQLKNEAIITYRLRTDGPVLINAGDSGKIDPTLSDMRFVRLTRRDENGVKSDAYLPGSSLKGVFRSRYEQLGKMITLDGKQLPVCDPFAQKRREGRKYHELITMPPVNCHDEISIRKDEPNGEKRYRHSCFACRLFGSLSLAGRVRFTDAYPVGVVQYGMRNGVGIDRITGGANGGKLFSFEVVEDGIFAGKIHLTNIESYQLYFMLWVLKDIHDGLVTVGMGGSRGNGKLKLDDDPACPGSACAVTIRQYVEGSGLIPSELASIQKKGILCTEMTVDDGMKLLDSIEQDELMEKIRKDGWAECYVR